MTGVTVQQSNDGINVTIAVSGDAGYEWHRLREPDNRFWVDIKNSQLQGTPIEQSEPGPLQSMRVRQVDPTTVRIALSLAGPKDMTLTPSATGLAVTIGAQDVSDEPRSGSGTVGGVVAAAAAGAGRNARAPGRDGLERRGRHRFERLEVRPAQQLRSE